MVSLLAGRSSFAGKVRGLLVLFHKGLVGLALAHRLWLQRLRNPIHGNGGPRRTLWGLLRAAAKPGRKAIRSIRKGVRASFDAVVLCAKAKKAGRRDE